MPEIGFSQPHLIEAGYKGFNIVEYSGVYYGFPQSQGPFCATEIGTKAYNRLPSASSPEAVRQRIDAMPPVLAAKRRISLRHIMPEMGFSQPHLIEAGYKGFNIVEYSGVYYGFPQSQGPFCATEIGTKAYNRLPSASSPEAVRQQIDAMPPVLAAKMRARGVALGLTPTRLLGAVRRRVETAWHRGVALADKAKSIVNRRSL
jgi:hypothetical protein